MNFTCIITASLHTIRVRSASKLMLDGKNYFAVYGDLLRLERVC